jgi:hypothetical protein
MELTLYQALEDRENREDVEQFGPFKCIRANAWMGEGYYFWDSKSDWAHWWGKQCYKDKYYVCGAQAILDSTCWDLFGNVLHQEEFLQLHDMGVKNGTFKVEMPLPDILIRIREHVPEWNYTSIRAWDTNEQVSFKWYADPDAAIVSKARVRNEAMTIGGRVQIYLFNKQALSLKSYRVIYPAVQ